MAVVFFQLKKGENRNLLSQRMANLHFHVNKHDWYPVPGRPGCLIFVFFQNGGLQIIQIWVAFKITWSKTHELFSRYGGTLVASVFICSYTGVKCGSETAWYLLKTLKKRLFLPIKVKLLESQTIGASFKQQVTVWDLASRYLCCSFLLIAISVAFVNPHLFFYMVILSSQQYHKERCLVKAWSFCTCFLQLRQINRLLTTLQWFSLTRIYPEWTTSVVHSLIIYAHKLVMHSASRRRGARFLRVLF